MLGLRRSATTLFDISQSLLRNVTFHGLRVQGIRVGNAEVPNNKPLKTGLQEVYGIGRRKSHQVLCHLGITNKLARDLTGKELIDLREEVGQHQHGDELRRRVGSEIQRLVEVDCYRGSRHRHGLPCRGQRTSTNARTKKGKAVAIAGKKKAPRNLFLSLPLPLPLQRKKNASNTVGGIVSSLLPNERIVLLCNVLVRRYFVLTASDLEEWYQNPESFHHEQDMIQWTEKLRPCAEALYMVLFENYSQLLGPIVVSILQEAMNNCPPSVTEITPALLLKDAAYAATAYVYYELSNYLNFRDWFNGALSLELSNDHPNRRIIHRKVAMILGHWVSEIKDDTKRAVYCALIKLLQDNDLAVKLAASRSLCLHVEDANFSEQSFLDLLPICWDSCFKMVEVVQEFDSKVQILNLISTLIGHVSEVIPYAQKLVQFFQKVWEESSGESLLQIQLLVALRNFVIALGYQSPICYSILLPILQKGIDINSPDSLNLLEDSMALWETTLSYAPMMVPQLLALFPYMVEIIERSFDHLQVAVSIMDSYIILDGGEFLNMHASSVAKILDLIVGNVNDKGLLSILPVIDILVQCFPVEVPPLISSCLQKLVIICLSGGDDRDPSKTAVKVSSAAILARILVMNTTYLAQLTSDSSLSVLLQQAGVPVEDNILLCLIDIWLDKVDHASPMQQKTFGLALSIILTLRMPQVLDKLDLILSTCTSVILGENKDLTEEESSGDMSSSRSQGEETPPSKELRKSQIKVSDPIYQMSLENSTRENLQTCSTLHGDAFNSAISRMHPSALAQVKQALKLP